MAEAPVCRPRSRLGEPCEATSRSLGDCKQSKCCAMLSRAISLRSIRLLPQALPVLRRIARNAAERKIDHRVVFGFTYQTAPRLVDFLRQHGPELEHVTGVLRRARSPLPQS